MFHKLGSISDLVPRLEEVVDVEIVKEDIFSYDEIYERLGQIEHRLPNGELTEIQKNMKEIKDTLLESTNFKIIKKQKNSFINRIINTIKKIWN